MIYSISICTLSNHQLRRRWQYFWMSLPIGLVGAAVAWWVNCAGFDQSLRTPTELVGETSAGIAAQAFGYWLLNIVSISGHHSVSARIKELKKNNPKIFSGSLSHLLPSINLPSEGNHSLLSLLHLMGSIGVHFGLFGSFAHIVSAWPTNALYSLGVAMPTALLGLAVWIFAIRHVSNSDW